MSKTSTTSYLKLAIPGNKYGVDDHIKKQEELFAKFIRRQYYVEIDGERTKVSNDWEDPLYETTFQIRTNDGFSDQLLSLISNFLYNIGTEVKDKTLHGSVALNHSDLFDPKLVCSRDPLQAEAIRFGNICNNQFFNHWTVDFEQRVRHPDHDRIGLYSIKTRFDFDKSRPITAGFNVEEIDENSCFARYQLALEGESIRQIIVDPFVSDSGASRRIYFILRYPIMIRRCSGLTGQFERTLELPSGIFNDYKSKVKVLTDNRVFCLEYKRTQLDLSILHTIISRMHCRWDIPIVFARFDDFLLNGKTMCTEGANRSAYFNRNPCYFTEPPFEYFLNEIFPYPRDNKLTSRISDRIKERRFAYTYLIEALLSRGSVVKDQLLLDRRNWFKFLDIIREHVNDDKDNSFYERHNLCESALEDLLNHVDNQPRVGDLIYVFQKLCGLRKTTRESNQLTTEEWDKGYRKVRKVIVTPTRKLYLAPETIMSNRAITGADHDGTRIIRVTFRDDNMKKMRLNLLKDLHTEKTMRRLEKGFCIMGRFFNYLASSNSQMRDGGAYFMERFNIKQFREIYGNQDLRAASYSFKPKILDYRKKLGKFEHTGSIPKAMARLGQCFTQARSCVGVPIGLEDYQIIPDAMGGKDLNGNPYTYTDGVGMISMKLARRISSDLGLHPRFIPSAFQFRFRGLKGMLVIDPGLDEKADYFKDKYRRGFMPIEMHEELDLAAYTFQCLFRESQKKFHCATRGKREWPIEIVKWSAPTPVTLNKPLINILDQVSALQSLDSHRRICGRIEQLLNVEMNSFSSFILNEEKCRSKLEGMPRRIHFASLQQKLGFSLSTEPFFRSLIKVSIDVAMMKLLRKLNIPIPSNSGRSMFGVTDETGQLQYGQVFVKYSENINNKFPTKTPGKVLKGKVMITKFPSMCAGDVRMYEAVDIPELYHLENVVVFPQTGPRSMPDEMAGSDLDGDEYAVIWDPLLFFERNEKAFSYSSIKPNHSFTPDEMDKKMNEFFAEYMKQEDVGVVSVNHLHQSDQFGINSNVCNILAEKSAMALDYSKSGVAPAPLTNEWTQNPANGEWQPPEKSERKPDFATNRYSLQVMYTSSRLLGTLHRELRSMNDVITTSAEKQIPLVIDELLVWNGWEKYAEAAKLQMLRYNGKLRSIMETFGVSTEAEVFSGSYREIRNRNSEKEVDDMSMYCTENVIETQVTALYKKFREDFFEEFAAPNETEKAYLKLTEPENVKVWEENDILRRVCRKPTDSMMAKAVAYYRTCYLTAIERGDKNLSFAWIAYDILNHVRSHKLWDAPVIIPRLPQLQAICDHRKSYVSDGKSSGRFSIFIKTISNNDENQKMLAQESQAIKIIKRYCLENLKLHECLFIVDSWARAKGLLRDESNAKKGTEEHEGVHHTASANSLKWYHLSLMVIMMATNKLGNLLDDSQKGIGCKIFEDINASGGSMRNGKLMSESDLDRLTLSFFRYLSTQEFRRLRSLNFAPIGLNSVFLRGEWLIYHTAAMQTYYNLLLNLRFDELPVSTEKLTDRRSHIREGDPFNIELPDGVEKEIILESLRNQSRCVEIKGRKFNGNQEKKDSLLISCRGTTEAINELRDLTSVKLPRYLWRSDTDRSENLAMSNALTHLFHFKIMGTVWTGPKEEKKPQNKRDFPNRRRSSDQNQNNRTNNGFVPNHRPNNMRRGGQRNHNYGRNRFPGMMRQLSNFQ